MTPSCPACHQPTARFERLTGLWVCPCGYRGPISAGPMVDRCLRQDSDLSALSADQQRALTPPAEASFPLYSTLTLAPSDRGRLDVIPLDEPISFG